jgi:hypothetical protein
MPSKKENETTEVAKVAPKKKTTRKKKEVVETPVEAVETTEFDLECSNGKGEDE